MDLERLKRTARARQERLERPAPPPTRHNVQVPNGETAQRGQRERVQKGADPVQHDHVERAEPGVRQRTRRVVPRAHDGREAEFFQVRTEREEAQRHRAVGHVHVHVHAPLARRMAQCHAQLREVRPPGLQRRQHLRAERDRVEREAAQRRLPLHDRHRVRRAQVAVEREVLERARVLEQHPRHGPLVKRDVEPRGPAGVRLQELRDFVPPRRIAWQPPRVHGEREGAAPGACEPVVVEIQTALLRPRTRPDRQRAPQPRRAQRDAPPAAADREEQQRRGGRVRLDVGLRGHTPHKDLAQDLRG